MSVMHMAISKRYQAPPDNQMAFDGMGLEGEELMREVRGWCAKHHLDYWLWWCTEAMRDGDETGVISADAVTHAMRRHFRIEISNDWVACFARIFAEEHPQYKECLTFKKSKADLFTKVAL